MSVYLTKNKGLELLQNNRDVRAVYNSLCTFSTIAQTKVIIVDVFSLTSHRQSFPPIYLEEIF